MQLYNERLNFELLIIIPTRFVIFAIFMLEVTANFPIAFPFPFLKGTVQPKVKGVKTRLKKFTINFFITASLNVYF